MTKEELDAILLDYARYNESLGGSAVIYPRVKLGDLLDWLNHPGCHYELVRKKNADQPTG